MLIKRITGDYPKDKGIHYYGKHDKAKDGETFKIISHYNISNIPKAIQINIFYE